MSKKMSLAHLFVFLLMAAFLFLGCPDSFEEEQQQSKDIPTHPVNLLLTGDISISPDLGVVVNDELTAKYTGPEVVSYQWLKNDVIIAGASGTKYTPVEAGSYTVEVSAAGYVSKTSDAVTVINVQGLPLFARSITTSGARSFFFGLALDDSGNAYAVGYLRTDALSDFGNGVTAKGVSTEYNPLIVKYNSDGVAQWAQSVTAGGDDSLFYAVAVDPSGDVYAVGYQEGNATHTYGGEDVTGTSAHSNAVIVKYSGTGAVEWAKTPSGSSDGSRFYGVAADASGVYVVGWQFGSLAFDYDGTAIASGASVVVNSVLVKFRTDGTGEWAYSTSTGDAESVFYAVALDSLGNIYAAGYQRGTGTFTYNGASTSGSFGGGENAVLVKYNSSGVGQWARSTSAGSDNSLFLDVAVDPTNNVYAVGYQSAGTYTYSGVSVSGSCSSVNAMLVKYNSSTGVGQWAMYPSMGNNSSYFRGVAADASGVYIAGAQYGNTPNTYGTVSVSGSAPGQNILLLKLSHSGVAQWARSTLTGSSASFFEATAVGASGVWAAGRLDRTSSYSFGNGVSIPSGYGDRQILLMKYQK